MKLRHHTGFFLLLFVAYFLLNSQIGNSQQNVPILNYSVDQNQRVQVEIQADESNYYFLKTKHNARAVSSHFVKMELGKNGKLILSESLNAYPKDQYEVVSFPKNNPSDVDKDDVDDLTEFADKVNASPLNAAKPISFTDGAVIINDNITFKKLSYKGEEVVADPQLKNLEYVKFFIIGDDIKTAYIYFQNSETHRSHASFKTKTKLNTTTGFGEVAAEMRGEVIFHPDVLSANGTPGVYRFQFQPTDVFPFKAVQLAHEILAANMPFLKNNLSYYPVSETALRIYEQEKAQFDDSRIPVLLEKDLFAEINYLALNQGEGYGLLNKVDGNEIPGSRDIVLYSSLPNEMPRSSGIITSVPQTPLSHVNLRAIQDKIPNAFIRNADTDSKINGLIGKYVHYKVKQNKFVIEETTKAAVDAWNESKRPQTEQIPLADYSVTKVLPLADISFEMSEAFGAKCANVATMQTFGFPKELTPDGFGIPFYFYREFMRHNGFYEKAAAMISDAAFINSVGKRIELLSDFRKEIINGKMPDWMLAQLDEMHKSFPVGTSVRCRSSTNNEDLPEFSGAGLYDSKTQHPDEGHIEKSIKQVYASLWNFRAFDERDFYRVNHLAAAMGVLCHPNNEDEEMNGVAVSTDPLYHTNSTFYLNNQIGEDLVTNPEALSIPEEILLDIAPQTTDSYAVIRYSNLSANKRILNDKYLNQTREYLKKIHVEFKKLYDAESDEKFAIEIEFKVTESGELFIKQARPWLGANTATIFDETDFRPLAFEEDEKLLKITANVYPNPFQDKLHISVNLPVSGELALTIFDLNGRAIWEENKGFYSVGKNDFDLQPDLHLPKRSILTVTLKTKSQFLISTQHLINEN